MCELLKQTIENVISVDETDVFERLKPSAILQYFQDIATSHAKILGVGYDEMLAQNLCWIVNRISYKIIKYPLLGDKISLTTYPKQSKIDAVRDYYITDKNNENIILGTSKWCVIDLENRSIKRCERLFNFEPQQYRKDEPFENGNPKLEGLNDLDIDVIQSFDFKVNISDLDRNRHMNNAKYGDVVLNCCNLQDLEQGKIEAFDINFLTELIFNDRFIVFRGDKNEISYFEAMKLPESYDNNSIKKLTPKDFINQKPVFRAKLTWTKND